VSDTVTLKLSIPKRTYQAIRQVAEQKHKSETELVVEAVEDYLDRATQGDPLLGLFADEPDLIDEIASEAMRGRENTPLRLSGASGG